MDGMLIIILAILLALYTREVVQTDSERKENLIEIGANPELLYDKDAFYYIYDKIQQKGSGIPN